MSAIIEPMNSRQKQLAGEEIVSNYFGVLKSQYEWLRKESYESHVSMSSLIREAIELLKKKLEKKLEKK